jgi:hypothetical protein
VGYLHHKCAQDSKLVQHPNKSRSGDSTAFPASLVKFPLDRYASVIHFIVLAAPQSILGAPQPLLRVAQRAVPGLPVGEYGRKSGRGGRADHLRVVVDERGNLSRRQAS